MAKWKLRRQTFGNEEFIFSEGEKVTIGRGLNNTVTMSSIVISREHCLLYVKRDEVEITDLKSSNGVYVGLKRIPQNVPYMLTDADVIGFGWTIGAALSKIPDNEQFVFKLEKCVTSITNRIQYQDDALDNIEAEIASFDSVKTSPKNQLSPILRPKLQLKRKLNIKFEDGEQNLEIVDPKVPKLESDDVDIINIISDSDNESNTIKQSCANKIKLETVIEDPQIIHNIKYENDEFQYEAFNVKQEYLGYNEEPIEINSDSDSESEHWYRRLSQSSPGKPLIKNERREEKSDSQHKDGSYSQLDDLDSDVIQINDECEEDFLDDLISIPLHPPDNQFYNEESTANVPKKLSPVTLEKPDAEIITLNKHDADFTKKVENAVEISVTENRNRNDTDITVAASIQVDKINLTSDHTQTPELVHLSVPALQQSNKSSPKTTQMIDPLNKITKRKSSATHVHESKSKSSHKSGRSKKHSSPKRKISHSQKEERKKKLKEIACKDKDTDEISKYMANNTNKSVVNVKITALNRGAFLTDVNQATVKPTKRKSSPLKGKEKHTDVSPKGESKITSTKSNTNNKCDKIISNEIKKTQTKETKEIPVKVKHTSHKFGKGKDSNTRTPFKNLKPLTESEESCLGKPVSIVEPLPLKKTKKKVRFSDAPPEVYEFEIEPGNNLKKTSSVKTTLVDVQKINIFSLEKLTLITILRWNPHWITEQTTINEPPPILGHKHPLALLHSFNSHKQYAGVIGDLLLMEIWECLTQAHNRTLTQSNQLHLRLESCPLAPPIQDRHIQLSNINVNLSLPTNELKRLPRVGDVMIVQFGPEQARRFVYVHNSRHLPSPPNNIHSFFSISLYAAFTEKMKLLRPGELIIGQTVSYIKNELILFEAIEYLAGSPLSKAILKPEPYLYPRTELNENINMNSQWTATLNPSQKLAVSNSVSAALRDRPSIQMVQGPPGTGKSSVICAIVMTYFYNNLGKKQQNRNKILICATSNAAVDGLIIKLLSIRQSLPKSERFGMVRVGRLESMHERARHVSSQQLAERDAARAHSDPARPGLNEEISHLQAKINMWKTAAREAREPERVAYCQSRVSNIQNRLALLRSGAGPGPGAVSSERLLQAERRTIEGADIVVTTLASTHNFKMRGLKGRIALCIVDEAGQAIEPETLIPLTLDVTRITLVGDPQQLPGYICSQRAKDHGLGESLFSRLTSCSEHWESSPVVLLNQQYRMHPEIADYPNRAFYNSLVRSVPPPAVDLHLPPYVVVGISSGDKGQGSSGANETEAWGVARLAAALAKRTGARQLSLAVITPYSAHRDLMRDTLRTLQAPSDGRVEVNTVDSFQGQERDVVVVSLARSRGVGFLNDAGRMNVMLTRAKHALFICLNPFAFVKNNQWQTLVDDARKRNVYRTLPTKFCQPTSSVPVSCDSALTHILNTQSNYHK